MRDGTDRDGSHMQFLAVPHHGLVRVAPGEVPDAAAPPRGLPFRAERTEWSWSAGVGHVGLDAYLGAERFCYEYIVGALRPMTCRDRE